MSELRFEMQEIPANLLEVDPGVQREVSPARVTKIANAFAEHSLGILVVSRRDNRGFADGSGSVQYRYVVLDGQTRLKAVRQVAGNEETTIPLMCQVYRNLSRREEAEIFLSHNDRAAVRKIDRFRIALVAQEQWARDINDVVLRYGYEVNPNVATGRRVTAVAAAEKLYVRPRGLDTLDRTFDTIQRAWNHSPGAASAEAILGIGLVYDRHPGAVKWEDLSPRLARAGSASRFVGEVKQRRHALGISLAEAAYRYVVQLHDKSRRSNRLGE